MPDLIDRHALKNHLYRAQAEAFKRREWYVAGSIQSFIDILEKQPTIEAVNRWIPCSERLPEVDKNVLIYYPKWEDAPVQTAHIMLDGLCWEFSDGEFYPSKNEITHWMPLPEPPEKR